MGLWLGRSGGRSELRSVGAWFCISIWSICQGNLDRLWRIVGTKMDCQSNEGAPDVIASTCHEELSGCESFSLSQHCGMHLEASPRGDSWLVPFAYMKLGQRNS